MRRKFMAWMLILSLLAALFVGCGADEPKKPNVNQTKPEQMETSEEVTAEISGTYGIAWQSQGSLHPYTGNSVTNRAIISLLYESLFVVTGSFQTEAVLCESCAVSEDGKIWHFDIKEGVQFSDGTELTATDVRVSIQSAMQSGLYTTRFAHVTSVTTDGAHSLTIKLNTPMENLPQLLDIPIVSANTVNDASPIGTGPYYLREQKLLRNPHYDRTEFSAVTAEQFDLIAANSPMEVQDAFEFGGADIAYTDPVSSNASDYHCDYELWSCPTTVMQYIGFNTGSQFFANPTLRSGVTYAIDRATILAELYDGFGQAATLACSPLAPYYDKATADLFGYNLGSFQSMQLTSGLMATTAQPVRLIVCASSAKRVEAAERIAATMGEVGFVVKVAALDEKEFQKSLKTGFFDLYLAEIRLPTNFDLSCFFAAGGTAGTGGAFNDAAQQLCLAALENHDNYGDLLNTVVRQGLICPIIFKTDGLYATRGVLGALSPSVSNMYVSGSGVLWTDILEETPIPSETEAESEETEESTEEATEEVTEEVTEEIIDETT